MRLPTPLLCALSALAITAACTEPAPSPEAPRATEAEAPSSAADEAPLQPSPNEGGAVRTNPVDDAAAGAAPRIAADRVSPEALEVAQRSPVPVLLPDDDALLAAAILTAGETWYAASIPGDDFVIAIQGTNAVHEMPGMGQKEAEESTEEPRESSAPVLSRTHGIVHIAFQEFGVSYTISIDGERPLENPRCAEDGFLLSLHQGAAILELP